RRRPDVVLGSGGYVSGPMVLAAALRRTPAALLEADAHLGLANRLAAPFATRVFLALPVDGRGDSKYRIAGRPMPRRSRTIPAAEARLRFELPREGPVLLVLGGSQGALALNELAGDNWGKGGPGLSGYALLARAWGAEVGGWDRVETPYLRQLDGARIELAPEPIVPEEWEEVVVSTAYRDQVEGKSRAELLAELVSLQRSIVV